MPRGFAFYKGEPWKYETHFRCSGCGYIDLKENYLGARPLCPVCGRPMRGSSRSNSNHDVYVVVE